MPKPLMTFESPEGDNLLFSSLRGTAELGRLYEYEVTLLSRNPSVDLRALIGKKVAVELALPGGERRKFAGYVTRFRQTGMRGRYYVYHASLRPWLWLMTRRTNSRIFQGQTIEEIVKSFFDDPIYQRIDYGAGTHWQMDHRTLDTRDYCVQYRESDFNFISRLLEDEGIHYWFWDDAGEEKLSFSDNLSAHTPVTGYETLPYARLQDDAEVIHEWRPQLSLRTGATRLVDYDFTNPPPFEPGSDFRMPLDRQHLDMDVSLDDFPDLELFDYPGGFVDGAHGESRVAARADEEGADWYYVTGQSNARGLSVGGKFKLERHPRSEQNDEYVVTRAEYELDFADYEGLDDTPQVTRYTCRFEASPTFRPYAPQRLTRRPFVQGPQTAIVVGPDGDEIHVDKYGRVKVHFLWDRYSKHNENSSCYVRVSHPWAGNQWGLIAIPRIGQEVIVDFLEGDPDHPIVTGRVYNAANMPPYDLPANATQTGIKTRSTPDGSIDNFNEIRFEDKKGAEQVYIHAERNMDTKVEADSSLSVDGHRTQTVVKTRTTTIKGDTDTLQIDGKHNVVVNKGEDYTVKEGGQVVRVNSGGQYLGSTSGKQEFYTDTGQQVTVKGTGGQKVYVEGGQGTKVTNGDAMLFVDGHDYKVGANNITQVSTSGAISNVASTTFFAQGADLKFKSKGQVLFACDGDFKIMNGGSYSVTNTGSTDTAKLGSWTDLSVSMGNTTSLALTNATSLGLTNATSLGIKFETAVSISMGVKLSVDLSSSLVKLDRNGLNTELSTIKLINGGAPAGAAAAGAPGALSGWGVASLMSTGFAGTLGAFNVFVEGAALANGALDDSSGANAYETAWDKASKSVAEGFFPDITSPPTPPTAEQRAAEREAAVPSQDPGAMGGAMSDSAPSAGEPR